MFCLLKELFLLFQELEILEEIFSNDAEKVILLGVLEHRVKTVLDILDNTGGDNPWSWFLPVPHCHLVIGAPRDRDEVGLLFKFCLGTFTKLQGDVLVGLDITGSQYFRFLFLINQINHNNNRRGRFKGICEKVFIFR